MTLVVIGPVTRDLVIIGNEKFEKVGGATYFQSFVFEEFYNDYLAVVNCSDDGPADAFPDSDKVKVIKKDDTHYFINEYPFEDNLDVRNQLSNFARIPIFKSDLEDVLPQNIDGFVLNPLNHYDFPAETIDYLKSFNVPMFLSVQGFLRFPDVKVNDNYTIKLANFDGMCDVLRGVNTIFLDACELNVIGDGCDVDDMVVTDGSRGSRIISRNGEMRIGAVRCENVVDTTGCGDTYMASYISKRLMGNTQKEAGNFASLIASMKIENIGPFKLR